MIKAARQTAFLYNALIVCIHFLFKLTNLDCGPASGTRWKPKEKKNIVEAHTKKKKENE